MLILVAGNTQFSTKAKCCVAVLRRFRREDQADGQRDWFQNFFQKLFYDESNGVVRFYAAVPSPTSEKRATVCLKGLANTSAALTITRMRFLIYKEKKQNAGDGFEKYNLRQRWTKRLRHRPLWNMPPTATVNLFRRSFARKRSSN
ncbi:hypothetical protein M514_02467 [Trichuris suis]|uniref:Uncharacterized protein n=1 Tax=Trichuris suis TaxID=68888 RepID=A0A085MHU4_9BILA|nr:hypothetical protein M513_02467 [Trichuris suis]KFD68137.1 hypothetical protein M514_02467 [Trichuris suis]